MAEDGFNKILGKILNSKIELNENVFQKISFKNKKYEYQYINECKLENNSHADRIFVDLMMFIYYSGSISYLYIFFSDKVFFFSNVIGLVLLMLSVLVEIFIGSKLTKFQKKLLKKIKFLIFTLINNLNIIYAIFNEYSNIDKIITSESLVDSPLLNTDNIYNKQDKILRLIIYNFILTNFLISLKFEANNLFSLFLILINSSSIVISIIKIPKNNNFYLELIVNILSALLLNIFRREWDRINRNAFIDSLRLDKIKKYIKSLFEINIKNNTHLINFNKDNLYFIDKKLEKLFNIQDDLGLAVRQDSRKGIEKLQNQKSLQEILISKLSNSNTNAMINRQNTDINKYNYKLDEFLSSLIYYEISDLTDNSIHDCLDYNKTKKSNYLRTTNCKLTYKLSIMSKSEKFYLVNSTCNNDNKTTLQEKFKEIGSNLFGSENTGTGKKIYSKKSPTNEEDLKLRRTHTRILNVSDNLNLVDSSSNDLSNIKNKYNFFSCNSNSKKVSNNSNMSKRAPSYKKNNNQKDAKNCYDKKSEFDNSGAKIDFIHLGIFYYVYSEKTKQESKDKYDFSSQFNILNNLDHLDDYHIDLNSRKKKESHFDFFEDNLAEEKNASNINHQDISDYDLKEKEEENLEKEIILKNRKAYFNVYFRKVKLFDNNNQNDLIHENNNNTPKNSNEDFFVEFVLIDITKEIKYHKKILKQKINWNNMIIAIDNEIRKPLNNLNYFINDSSRNEILKESTTKKMMLTYLNTYLLSNFSFNSILNKNLKLKQNPSNLNFISQSTVRLEKIFEFIRTFTSDFLNVRNLEFSNLKFKIKNEILDIGKFIINIDETLLLKIIVRILINIIKFNEIGFINIYFKEVSIQERKKVEFSIFYNREQTLTQSIKKSHITENESNIMNRNLFLNDDNAIISKYHRCILKNEILISTENSIKNPFRDLTSNCQSIILNSPEINTNDDKEKYLIFNNNNYEKNDETLKNYFLSLYKKIMLKTIMKKENLLLEHFKNLLKAMSINFESQNDFIYGKDCKFKFIIPFKIAPESSVDSYKININNNKEENNSFIGNLTGKKFTFDFKSENSGRVNMSFNKSEDYSQDNTAQIQKKQTLTNNSETNSKLKNSENFESPKTSVIRKKTITQVNFNQSFNRTQTLENFDLSSVMVPGKNKNFSSSNETLQGKKIDQTIQNLKNIVKNF